MKAGSRRPALIRIGLFRAPSAIPVVVASAEGFFAANGIEASVSFVHRSSELVDGLVDGTYSVIHCAPDNLLLWRDNAAPDLCAWIGGSNGPLTLLARPPKCEIRTLRGSTLAVDSLRSGSVVMLAALLGQNGLRTGDYGLLPVGDPPLRLAAVNEGTATATLLSLPWSISPSASALCVVAENRQLPHVHGTCGASLRSWLDDHPAVVDAYFRAVARAHEWSQRPANWGAFALAIARLFEVPEILAEETLKQLRVENSWDGPMIDPVRFRATWQLRAEIFGPPAEPAESYYTLEPGRRSSEWSRHE